MLLTTCEHDLRISEYLWGFVWICENNLNTKSAKVKKDTKFKILSYVKIYRINVIRNLGGPVDGKELEAGIRQRRTKKGRR